MGKSAVDTSSDLNVLSACTVAQKVLVELCDDLLYILTSPAQEMLMNNTYNIMHYYALGSNRVFTTFLSAEMRT